MVAFNLPGGVPVYAFSVLLGLGAAAGLAWVAGQAPRGEAHMRLNAGLWALLGALAGGRAAYIAANWPYFQSHLSESWQVFLGGLSWPGALAGGLLAVFVYADLTGRSPGALADALLPLLSILVLSAWLGCWLDGCAYGPPVNAWWAVPARDEWGALELRWPVQLFGALYTLGLFWLLDQGWFPNRKLAANPGRIASLGVLGIALQLLAAALLRADPSPHWHGLRLDGWAALAFAGVAALALLLSLFKIRIHEEIGDKG